MSEIKTNLKLKTASNTYTQKYPISKSNIVKRDTSSTSNIIGTTLEECLQSTANRYIPQNGKSWITFTPPTGTGVKAMCSDGNFIFMKVGSNCKWSFDGGKTFTGSGTISSFANASVMNCKRTKVSGAVWSYHVAVASNNVVQSIRIDGESTSVSYTNADVDTTISSPNSIYFTDGAWYVYGANKIARITNLNGGTPVETQPSSHTHMSQSIYASGMGMYVTIDNGTVVLSTEKLGGDS